jgi:hypothetical protein
VARSSPEGRGDEGAALATGTQNRFWDYTEPLLPLGRHRGRRVRRTATSPAWRIRFGLNISNWRSARHDSALISQLQCDQQAASVAEVQGTPALTFEGPR